MILVLSKIVSFTTRFLLTDNSRVAAVNYILGSIMNKLILKLKRHIPDILFATSLLGVGLTAYTAHKDTLRQQEVFNFERPETKSQKALCYIESYWRTVLVASGTAASMIFCRKLMADRIGIVMATCMALEEKFGTYRDTVRKHFGEEKENDIYIETAQELDSDWDSFPELPAKADKYDDSYVFYDTFSKRYFVSSVEKVQQAIYHLNYNFVSRKFAFANEYYGLLGVKDIPNGDDIGWEWDDMMDMGINPWIHVTHKVREHKDGVKYYILAFEIEPTVEAIERAIG